MNKLKYEIDENGDSICTNLTEILNNTGKEKNYLGMKYKVGDKVILITDKYENNHGIKLDLDQELHPDLKFKKNEIFEITDIPSELIRIKKTSNPFWSIWVKFEDIERTEE